MKSKFIMPLLAFGLVVAPSTFAQCSTTAVNKPALSTLEKMSDTKKHITDAISYLNQISSITKAHTERNKISGHAVMLSKNELLHLGHLQKLAKFSFYNIQYHYSFPIKLFNPISQELQIPQQPEIPEIIAPDLPDFMPQQPEMPEIIAPDLLDFMPQQPEIPEMPEIIAPDLLDFISQKPQRLPQLRHNYKTGYDKVAKALEENKIEEITSKDDLYSYITYLFNLRDSKTHKKIFSTSYIKIHCDELLKVLVRLNDLLETK